MEGIVLIHTRRGLEHRRGLVFYSWIGIDKAGIQDVTVDLY